jgi:hypothetical protein
MGTMNGEAPRHVKQNPVHCLLVQNCLFLQLEHSTLLQKLLRNLLSAETAAETAGCPVPPSAFQRPALEGGPAFETPAKPELRMQPPDRSASATSVESLKSPFASMSAEVKALVLQNGKRLPHFTHQSCSYGFT